MNRFGATEQDQAALAASIRQLDELFLLVVVGEFNAGKSAFINALAGQTVLQEGVTPTTAQIHLLKYGDGGRTTISTPTACAIVTAPVELLRDVHIVDTPGTNAIIREHERLTTEFVPRADLVLFVTSADRPFTETERAFLETIRDWGKKIVIVVNKVDIFEPAELDEVLTFVRALGAATARLHSRALSGERAAGACAPSGRAGAVGGQPVRGAWKRFIPEHARRRQPLPAEAGQPARRRPGAGAPLRDDRRASACTLLREDMALLEDIDRQLAVYREDLARGFELRMTAVEKVLARHGAARPRVLRGHAADRPRRWTC